MKLTLEELMARQPVLLPLAVILACVSVSCATPTPAQPSATVPTTQDAAGDRVSPEQGTLPLAETGPYRVGVREFSTQDPSRDGRAVGIRVWYPALQPEDGTGKRVLPKAEPDRSGAPYPLIVSSAKTGSNLAAYLVTHGFVWAGVTVIDTWDAYNSELIEQPLDILFALDQVASNPPEELAGMIDTDRAGATGYSFDGYNALALSGARIDPAFYLAQCASADATAEAILSTLENRYQCAAAVEWDEFTAQAGEAITTSEDGLWQPITDPRIRAVVPLAAEGWLLFGDRGLAAVDRPTLLLVGTGDIWYSENGPIFEHLGTPDKALISFVGEDHMMIFDPEMDARLAHFMTAFFGYHLQGREDLATYFSEDFVASYDDLAWGMYQGE
jgi:predicted dienelactone hydrolase